MDRVANQSDVIHDRLMEVRPMSYDYYAGHDYDDN